MLRQALSPPLDAASATTPVCASCLLQAGRLTKGLWLVWGYQGDKTLAYYLKRRDCVRALSIDLGVEEEAAVPTAVKQIFECLSVGAGPLRGGWVGGNAIVEAGCHLLRRQGGDVGAARRL